MQCRYWFTIKTKSSCYFTLYKYKAVPLCLSLPLFFLQSFHYYRFKWVALELGKCQPNQRCRQCAVVLGFFHLKKAVTAYQAGQGISSHMDSRSTWAGPRRYTSACHGASSRIYWEEQKHICCCCYHPKSCYYSGNVLLHHLFFPPGRTTVPRVFTYCMPRFSPAARECAVQSLSVYKETQWTRSSQPDQSHRPAFVCVHCNDVWN